MPAWIFGLLYSLLKKCGDIKGIFIRVADKVCLMLYYLAEHRKKSLVQHCINYEVLCD